MSEWRDTIRTQIKEICERNNTHEFELQELLDFSESTIENKFPDNNTPDAAARRTLQELRDNNEIEFQGNGRYRVKELNIQSDQEPSTDLPIPGTSVNLKLQYALAHYNEAKSSDDWDHPVVSLITSEIPDEFKSQLSSERAEYYTISPDQLDIRGSTGKGRMANIPWIGVFDQRVSGGPQSGLYVVYLFDTVEERLFLTLNQGMTQLSENYGLGLTKEILSKRAEILRGHIDLERFEMEGIDLPSQLLTGRNKHYGNSTICYRSYTPDNFPNKDELVSDLFEIVDTYQSLVNGGFYDSILESFDEDKGFQREPEQHNEPDPANEYETVSEAVTDISDRISVSNDESNWLADQLNETIVRDWTDAIRGLEPGSVISVGQATKISQIQGLYTGAADRLEEQAGTLQSGSLTNLSPGETLFVVFFRELQDQIDGEPTTGNEITLALREDYKIETTEPREPRDLGVENTDHPLVDHLQTNDVEIYKFTAPPDNWLTVFEYAAVAFERSKEAVWEKLTPGDVLLFHATSTPSWNALDTQSSGLIGAGIVRTKTTKGDREAWWYDEHEDRTNRDSYPLLVAFERLFASGQLEKINLTDNVTEKSQRVVAAELEALTNDHLPFDEVDEICQTVSNSGFPQQRVLVSLGTSTEYSKGMALADALAAHLQEIPPVALHKSFTGSLPESILDGLYFPDGEGKEILEQIQVALRTGKHLILTGPPGTGKTEIVHRVSEYLETEYPYLFSGYQMTTATADWSTFDTVGGYMPDAESETGNELEFSPGLILNRLKNRHEYTQRNEPLVIDELNRADIDKAFGQLFTLLSGQAIQLPYTHEGSEIELSPANDASNAPAAHEYVTPESWRLFATLNTYDKTSLYEMSYAFMRRFAFIRVPAPTLPSDRTALTEIMRSYADGWAISVSDVELQAVGEVWRATNTSVEDRSIGPAVVKDILASVEAHLTASRSVRLTQAVISFICPQLEGVPKREQILRQIAAVPDVDDEMLDEAARDMLQVSLNTDE